MELEEKKIEGSTSEPEEMLELANDNAETDETVEEVQKPVPVAPFLRGKDSTAVIMRDVVFALAPAAIFSVYRFGFRAFMILLLSVTSCVLAEHFCKKVRKAPNGGYECSAVVTGLLFGLMLPLNVPYWFPVVGGMFAIGIVKMLFGGLGRNRLNPAATAKCLFLIIAGPVMNISLKGYMITWSETDLMDLFFGFGVGMIGEISAFLLLLGGLYLVLCKVITLHTPVAYLVSFSAVLLAFGGHGLDTDWLAMQLCIGGVLLGAFFLVTDYSTSPMTKTGKVIFGVLVGALTGVLRIFEFTTEAVVVAVLCGNLITPLIDIVRKRRG